MDTNSSKGFTLIELLLAIAIIGILSAIVTGYLNEARGKGADAKVKSQLVQLRSAIELYYSNNGHYGTTVVNGSEPVGASVSYGCASGVFNDATLANYILKTIYPGTAFLNSKCTSNGSAYAISIHLNNPNQYWCIDSTGASRLTSAMQANSVYSCPP
jgi:prepilin-type N-terminal cleavage/methylation domain-containing protein